MILSGTFFECWTFSKFFLLPFSAAIGILLINWCCELIIYIVFLLFEGPSSRREALLVLSRHSHDARWNVLAVLQRFLAVDQLVHAIDYQLDESQFRFTQPEEAKLSTPRLWSLFKSFHCETWKVAFGYTCPRWRCRRCSRFVGCLRRRRLSSAGGAFQGGRQTCSVARGKEGEYGRRLSCQFPNWRGRWQCSPNGRCIGIPIHRRGHSSRCYEDRGTSARILPSNYRPFAWK